MMSTVTGLDNPNEELWPRITLDQRPGDRTTLSATRPPIRPRQNPGTARLSFAQERLWFLDQINPGDLSSNISRGVRISGATDINKLNQAVQAVVARHESLRTTFAKDELQADSRPAQLVKKTASAELRILDLSSLPEANREQEVKQTARYEAQRPFDLSLGPLLRLAFLRLTQSDSVLLLNTHRIVCDEYSSQVFFDELSLAYRAFANDQLPQFDELPIQYADYAEWQREWLRGNALEGELDYWKKKLGGAPSVIDLRFSR